jgi:hypothetical protein
MLDGTLLAFAQLQYCSTGICIALSIAAATELSSTPEILMTVQTPRSTGWFSIGFGSRMSDSLMLVAWPYLNQILVSPRLGIAFLFQMGTNCPSGHSMPLSYPAASVQVLSSNITNDFLIVQLKCSNCTLWTGGHLDIFSTATDLMWASAPNGQSDPSDLSSVFPKHKDYGTFKMNMTAARGSTSTFSPTINTSLPNSPNSDGGITMRQGVFHTTSWF